MRKLLKLYWQWAGARNRVSNSKAKFIAVTGSAAKSSTTLLLAHILNGAGKLHLQAIKNGFVATTKTLHTLPPDADWCLMEVGLDRPGSVEKMARLIKPHVSIVTTVGLDHYQQFRSREKVAKEKGNLVEQVQPGGFVVLNADDENVRSMATRTKERIVTFSRRPGADYTINQMSSGLPKRLSLSLQTPNGTLELQTKFAAEHQYVAVVAAVSCALELGIDPEFVRQQVENFEPWWDRCQPLKIPGGPTFLVDTLKAPLWSFGLALDTLDSAQYSRKRVVIGQLADHSGNTQGAIRKVKRLAEPVADQLIFVGHSPRRVGVTDDEIANGRYKFFDNAHDVANFLRDTAISEELILVKSSKILHMERVVLAWLTDVNCWVDRCKKTSCCLRCGRYSFDFGYHKGVAPVALLKAIKKPQNNTLKKLNEQMEDMVNLSG